jgi:C-terminal processing protease CtpA/Prc
VQAGVGVFFQQEVDGNVYVKTIVSGGAAERDGLIQCGDIIVAVDDREVHLLIELLIFVWEKLYYVPNAVIGQSLDYWTGQVIGEPLPVLRNLILGQQGTTVKLTLQRREGGEVHQFETKLMRGTAEYFQSLSVTRSMEDEIDQLRLQLR